MFASVPGVSKVGYYDGSVSSVTVTTGFQPRFVIIKSATYANQDWVVLDTTRGWGSGNDELLHLNENTAQDNSYNLGAPTSTGFTIDGLNSVNRGNEKYIYYAHA